MPKRKSIIGSRVKIDYYDQNEKLVSLLPRRGIVTRQLQAEGGVDDWFLIRLDIPFDYPIKSPDGFSFTYLHCEDILVRSRWKKHRIGGNKPTSVFILLIQDEKQLLNDPIDIEKFYHVAWGMCYTEQLMEASDIYQ